MIPTVLRDSWVIQHRDIYYASTSCFVKMIIRCDTPLPKGKFLQVLLWVTDRYGSLNRNRNPVM